MTPNQILSERVRKLLKEEPVEETTSTYMTGFTLNGILACGVHKDFLVVNVGEDRMEEILTHPLARVFSMAGCVEIVPAGIARDVDLAGWVRTGIEYARSLSQDS